MSQGQELELGLGEVAQVNHVLVVWAQDLKYYEVRYYKTIINIIVTSNIMVSLDSDKKVNRVGDREGATLASCLSQASPTTLAILNLESE